jgi:glycosyltransferase involved in cell wall biosynthesis
LENSNVNGFTAGWVASQSPKVSVCVMTYNQEKYIAECLQSIIEQKTDFIYEVIVADDCSTDRTQEIIKEFAKKYPDIFIPVLHEKNLGPGLNYQSAHDRAKGEYVAHIDGDDVMMENKLVRQLKEFENDVNLVICWHGMNRFGENGYTENDANGYLFKYPEGIVTLESALKYGSPGAHSSCMYRRAYKPKDLPKQDFLDMFVSWRILESGYGKIIPEILGRYRVGSGITSNNSKKIRKLAAEHANTFLMRHEELKRSVFIFSFFNSLSELKGLRSNFLDFALLAYRSFKWNFLLDIPSELVCLKNASRYK